MYAAEYAQIRYAHLLEPGCTIKCEANQYRGGLADRKRVATCQESVIK